MSFKRNRRKFFIQDSSNCLKEVLKVGDNKVTKRTNFMYRKVNSRNFGAAVENFGLRKFKHLKRGLKKVKGNQKKVTKTTDTFTFYWENLELLANCWKLSAM